MWKRTLLCMAMLLMIMMGCTVCHAESVYTSGNWNYTVSNGSARLKAWNGSGSSVTIPSSIDGYTVTCIGSKLLAGSSITYLSIPATIEKIESGAFSNCRYLRKIDYYARQVTNSSSSSNIFGNAGSLSGSLEVTFGSSVIDIPKYLFSSYGETYPHVTRVTMSNGVRSIGNYAFRGCYDLSGLAIGANVAEIGEGAFQSCTKLTKITIPKLVDKIGYYAFKDCKNLSELYYNAINCTRGYRAFDNAGQYRDSLCLVIGSGVRLIPAGVFNGYSSTVYPHFTSIAIPSTVTKIGRYAFQKCYDLKRIKARPKTCEIDRPFENCTSGLVVTCYRNSTIAKYAAEKGYKISYLDSKPTDQILKTRLPAGSTEKEAVGASFTPLALRQTGVTKNSITISWNKVNGASFYLVYGSACGKAFARLTKTSALTFVHKNLKSGVYRRYVVFAMNSSWAVLKTSKTAYISTTGGKYCNYKSLSFKKSSVYVNKGAGSQLQLTQVKGSPSHAMVTHRALTYASTNKLIATVDKKGNVYGQQSGKCEIYAYQQNGTYAKCSVIVRAVPTSVSISEKTVQLNKRKTKQLKETVYPSDAADKSVTWKSSNNSVASVSQSGVITTNQAGTAIIYAVASNGISASCQVTVWMYAYGDVNLDGIIDQETDALLILRHTAYMKDLEEPPKNRESYVTAHPEWRLTGAKLKAADLNKDGQINSVDVLRVLRHQAFVDSETVRKEHPEYELTEGFNY